MYFHYFNVLNINLSKEMSKKRRRNILSQKVAHSLSPDILITHTRIPANRQILHLWMFNYNWPDITTIITTAKTKQQTTTTKQRNNETTTKQQQQQQHNNNNTTTTTTTTITTQQQQQQQQ